MEDILEQLQGNGHLLLSAYQNTLDLRKAMGGDNAVCSKGNKLAREIKTRLYKGVCHHPSSLECSGEVDILDDATATLLDYLDKIVEGTDKSVLVLDLEQLKQQILPEPWYTMTHIDCEGNKAPVKKVLTAIFNQLERYIGTI